jgi:IS5 family transposase
LKAIGFPTDAKLLHAPIRGLNRLVKEHAVKEHAVKEHAVKEHAVKEHALQLRQSYLRVAKRVAMMVGLALVGGRPYQYFSRQRLRL